MTDADATNYPSFPRGFVKNVFQHHCVPACRCGHQSLSRLAQGKGTFVVLHRKVRHHDPIYLVTEGSRFGLAVVSGAFTIVCAAFPQWHDVIVGQIHIVSEIHDVTCVCILFSVCQCHGTETEQPRPNLQVRVQTLSPCRELI